MRIRVAHLSELDPSVAAPKPVTYPTTECPHCKGSLWNMGTYFYCSTEDPHPGGLIVYPDGRARRLDGGTIASPISVGESP